MLDSKTEVTTAVQLGLQNMIISDFSLIGELEARFHVFDVKVQFTSELALTFFVDGSSNDIAWYE